MNRSRVIDVALIALPALVVVGVLSFAAPCGVHDDGGVSSCFWAGRAVLGVGVVGVVAAALRLRVGGADGIAALDVVLAALGVLVALLPGVLVDLCMMQTMRCHAVMRPAMLLLGAALALLAVADAVRVRGTGRAGA